MLPSFREDDSSQIPAVHLLVNMGYTYLSAAEALRMRGDRTSNVLLEPVLREQLKRINAEKQISSTRSTYLSDATIEKGIKALKDLPFQEGYLVACEVAYERLTMGKSIEQNIDGEVKSFTLQYIDWTNWSNNVFHVTEELNVQRTGTKEHYRPDVVLYVNGIPLCIIECKRPDLKDAIGQAISQHTRNQYEDGIRHLYVYSQVVMAVATLTCSYATTDTKAEYWAQWKEEVDPKLADLINLPLENAVETELLAERDSWQRAQYSEQMKQRRSVSPQDAMLYQLCRPERLLALAKDYILFEAGQFKKIARYQQFFSIQKIVARVRDIHGERRTGGVIWHTQGSGKSLTMALLAKQIFQTVRNPKILVVTDRVDLDDQISDTFRKVGVSVKNARTGNHLAEILQSKSDAVVTTIVNKFEAALKKMEPLTTPDLFVLIDEGHRTQYGTFNVKMQKVLPNACFLAFTGTPLMKSEKSTAQKFGGIIDAYTIREAVADGAIVPILYEGRHAIQEVNQKAIDKGFERIASHLSEPEQADLKRKNSRANLIAGTEQRIHEIAEDISAHFEQNWGRDRTGDREIFKGMVVTPSKAVAIRYKKAFDLIGKLSTEVIISAPDDREGNDQEVYKPSDDVVDFYHGMQKRYGKDFEKPLIERFKKTDQPELLIVVDKLLTGFDVPRVVVMYLCRKLKDHTLLQAIARVNRVAEGKNFGFIIDYEGILSQLDTAMQVYSNLDDFEEADLEGTFTDMRKELEKLPQAHNDLLDIFKGIANKMDLVAYSILLTDEAIRTEFYQKFSAFARLLKIALSSIDFERNTDENLKELYKKHLIWFAKLRNQVIEVHSEQVDFKQYEKQLQKLLDQHVTTDEVIRITEQVSILDTEAFEREIQRLEGDRARAETIASRTAKHITAHMDEDPTFFKRLSELIQETIADMRALRLSEADALAQIKALAEQAVTRNSDDVPKELVSKDYAVPFYRFVKTMTECTETQGVRFALETDAIVQKYKIVDWQHKPDVVKKMSFFISEYLIDEHKLPVNKAEDIANECVNMAKKRYQS